MHRRKTVTMRALATVGSLACLVGLATGCGSHRATVKGSSPTPVPSSTTASLAPTTTLAPPATTASSAPPQPPASTTSTTGTPVCLAQDLKPTWTGNGNGASGVLYYPVNMTNVSSSACETGGYFGAAAYDPNGVLLVGTETRDPSLNPSANSSAVTVSPGATISFVVGFPDNNGSTSCNTNVGSLHLTPPNDTSQLQVATPRQSGGFPLLCQGKLLIGPVSLGSKG
jgi:hypothetical protein